MARVLRTHGYQIPTASFVQRALGSGQPSGQPSGQSGGQSSGQPSGQSGGQPPCSAGQGDPTTTRAHAQRSISEEFRDIVLPRPLPDPPEYVREQERQGRQAGGEGAREDTAADGSFVSRLREGLVMYADTWRREDGGAVGDAERVAGDQRGFGTGQPSSAEEASRLLEEVQLGSASVRDIVKNKYAVRARAFQLAVKEFVVGWHETRHRG